MLYLLIFILLSILGCSHCSGSDLPPNVQQQEGSEYCPDMCSKFEQLNCIGYYEPIPLDDGGIMSCIEFCEYELQNSIALNPECLKDISSCNEIETTCK